MPDRIPRHPCLVRGLRVSRDLGQRLVAGNGGALARRASAFAQQDAQAAKLQWRKVADRLRAEPPKRAKLMAWAAKRTKAEADAPAHMDVPVVRRGKIHSTNPIERLSAEIERRTDMAGIFPSDAAIVRLVGAPRMARNDCVGRAAGSLHAAGSHGGFAPYHAGSPDDRPAPPESVMPTHRCSIRSGDRIQTRRNPD